MCRHQHLSTQQNYFCSRQTGLDIIRRMIILQLFTQDISNADLTIYIHSLIQDKVTGSKRCTTFALINIVKTIVFDHYLPLHHQSLIYKIDGLIHHYSVHPLRDPHQQAFRTNTLEFLRCFVSNLQTSSFFNVITDMFLSSKDWISMDIEQKIQELRKYQMFEIYSILTENQSYALRLQNLKLPLDLSHQQIIYELKEEQLRKLSAFLRSAKLI